MRHLVAVLVLALLASVVPAASASARPQGGGASTFQKATSSKSKSKKKGHKKSSDKNKSGSGTVTLDSIPSVKHGKSGFEITATVSKAGLTCDLKIKYADGSGDHPDSVTSDKDKSCTFQVDIPDDSGVAGEASAEVTLKDADGKKLASDKKSFTVK